VGWRERLGTKALQKARDEHAYIHVVNNMVIHSVQDVELVVDMLQQAILLSCYQDCPARVAVSQRTDSWWNKEFRCLEASTKRVFNQGNMIGDWESYKMAPTFYKKDIRKANQSSWMDYCWGMEDVTDSATLMRMMTSQLANRVESSYLMADIHSLEKRPQRNYIAFIFQGLL
jgi:ferredoxin-like protein FixX